MIYYRPDFDNGELLTEEQYKRFCDVFNEKDSYNKFEFLEEFHDSGSGIHKVNNIMLTIQSTAKLNAEDKKIRERLEKRKGKVTPSKVNYIGNACVEAGLIFSLVDKAIQEINICSEPEDRIHRGIPHKELLRLYGIPYKGIMQKVEKAEKEIQSITEPVHRYELKYHYTGSDSTSAFQTNGILVKFKVYSHYTFNAKVKELYKKFPYIGKVYYFDSNSTKFLELNVYDKHGRDWAVQNVIHELVQMDLIEL